MKFQLKTVCCMIILMALFFGAGSSALISITFQASLDQEKNAAQESYCMILNTLQVVNGMEHWTEKTDISKILDQLSGQNVSWSALRLHSKKKTLYSKGDAAEYFTNLNDKIDPNHLACTIVTMPEQSHYLQLSGSFYVGKQLYYLDAAYNIDSIYEVRGRLQNIYQQIFLILLLACACLSFILAFFLTRPLAKLSRASREIASGNYDYRSNIKSNDEVGSVSRDFDLMADHLQDSIEELEASVEQQNLFTENFTHELKTPMTSIIGYADLLRSQSLSKEDELEAINYIFSEGKRLERLSLKLLDIFTVKSETFPLTKTSVAEIIQNLAEHLKPVLAQEAIFLNYDCEPGLCMLDSDFFYSLLVNLIENARKAITNGGIISVKSIMTDDGCCVTISDDGVGIPAEAIGHITEAFYRVDKARSRSQGGAGLGLALCAKIVSLHHGDISFQSTEGLGTTVTVQLRGGRA